MTPRPHSPKGDGPKAACGAGWHLPLAARVFISRRGEMPDQVGHDGEGPGDAGPVFFLKCVAKLAIQI